MPKPNLEIEKELNKKIRVLFQDWWQEIGYPFLSEHLRKLRFWQQVSANDNSKIFP